jgi:hypothetical protein
MVVVAAMLATTLARRSALVRSIRFLGPPPPGKKKRQQAGVGDADASLSDGLIWPDSQHDTSQPVDGGGDSGGANGGHDGDSGFSFGDS